MKVAVICVAFAIWTSSVQSAWDFSISSSIISGLPEKKTVRFGCPSSNVREMVRTAFGCTSKELKEVIEEPTNYNYKRIQCSSDRNALSLTIDRDLDNDSVTLDKNRQRLEIKTPKPEYGGPVAKLGSTFVYAWRFKLNANIKPSPVASDFFHIFQIKRLVEGTNPPVTLSLHSSGYLRLHIAGKEPIKLVPISQIAGVWTEAVVKVYYHESKGYVEVKLKNEKTQSYPERVVDISFPNNEFRSKWGLYRSKNNTYNKEDTLLLQNIQIYGKP